MTKRDAGRMESADDYPVVADLGPKWRVIACRDGEQWILQHRSNKWEGRAYCRSSVALRRVVREHVGTVELPKLPKWLRSPCRPKSRVRADSATASVLADASTPKPAPTPVSGPPG
jgi:hypothetical protein